MRVLIVEDEPNLGRQLRSTLEGAGYAVDLATDGEDGHYLGSTESYDAVILDLGLPEVDGLTVLDRWRKEGRKMPVLVLTARDSWSDKVAGLDAGADDYLAKPFQTEELIARLRALIRRSSGNASSELIAGDIRLDTRSGKVTKAGEPVKLTAQEYKLLPTSCTTRARWSAGPSSSSISTTRTSTAIPTPSRCSSRASARSSAPT